MTARSALALAALLLAAPRLAPLRAQGLEYAPGTHKYRLSTSTKGSQSSPMGNQDFQIDAQQQLTVNLARQAKDTMVATVTLDSISLKSPQLPQDVSKLAGAKFVSYLSPTGKFYSAKAVDVSNPMMSQLSESAARFLPFFRGDLKPGLAWSDTTTGRVTQQGMDVDRTITNSYKVLGDTTVNGEPAHKVSRVSVVKAAGSGTAQGTPVSLESATTSNALILISPKGVYLGGTQNDDVNVKLVIIAQNAEVRIKQSSQLKIDPIK
jgi:hypothetical protein